MTVAQSSNSCMLGRLASGKAQSQCLSANARAHLQKALSAPGSKFSAVPAEKAAPGPAFDDPAKVLPQKPQGAA